MTKVGLDKSWIGQKLDWRKFWPDKCSPWQFQVLSAQTYFLIPRGWHVLANSHQGSAPLISLKNSLVKLIFVLLCSVLSKNEHNMVICCNKMRLRLIDLIVKYKWHAVLCTNKLLLTNAVITLSNYFKQSWQITLCQCTRGAFKHQFKKCWHS